MTKKTCCHGGKESTGFSETPPVPLIVLSKSCSCHEALTLSSTHPSFGTYCFLPVLVPVPCPLPSVVCEGVLL